MLDIRVSNNDAVLEMNEKEINRDLDHASISIDMPEILEEIEREAKELEEKILLQASNLDEYYRLMNENGLPMEMDQDPVKIRDLGSHGVVILTNYGTISTTENLPNSIREEIESTGIDSPEIMNQIESLLKSKEIDYTATNSIGRADHAAGKVDTERENPEAEAYMDSASTRKEAARDIAEDNTYGTYGQEENAEVSRNLTEEEMRRLKLEYEEKYGNRNRGQEEDYQR